jgi:hypothetical protein
VENSNFSFFAFFLPQIAFYFLQTKSLITL